MFVTNAQLESLKKLLRDSKLYLEDSEAHLCDSDFELDGALGDSHSELEVITFPAAVMTFVQIESNKIPDSWNEAVKMALIATAALEAVGGAQSQMAKAIIEMNEMLTEGKLP